MESKVTSSPAGTAALHVVGLWHLPDKVMALGCFVLDAYCNKGASRY